MLLVTSVLSAAVVGAIGCQFGRSPSRESVFDRLTEIRQIINPAQQQSLVGYYTTECAPRESPRRALAAAKE